MSRLPFLMAFSVAMLAAPAPSQVQKGEFLTEEEQDKLREAQDPSARIEVYLALTQARLDRFENFRVKPADPKYDNGTYLDELLDNYVALNDELKNWIDEQFERHGDMRHGLRSLLDRGPKQLEELRRIQRSPDAYAPQYADELRDAIDDLTDTLDGATKALAEQERKFAETKREEKAAVRSTKEKRKEEEKRSKEENKLRKRQRKKGVPAEPDQN